MWTVSAFQQHPSTLFICDEDATLELRVKTVKYFKDLWSVHAKLNHMDHLLESQCTDVGRSFKTRGVAAFLGILKRACSITLQNQQSLIYFYIFSKYFDESTIFFVLLGIYILYMYIFINKAQESDASSRDPYLPIRSPNTLQLKNITKG